MSFQRTLHAALVVLSCAASSLGSAAAQSTDAAEPTREQLQIQIDILKDRLKQSDETIKRLQTASDQASIDPEVLKAYIEAQKRQYEIQNEMQQKQSEYVAAILDWNIKAMERQRFAYGVILFLVTLLVVSGTAFSGFQLWRSSGAAVQASNDFEVSASRIRLTSSVVGLMVLLISVIFLYIYIREIYAVRVIDTGGAQSAVKAPEADSAKPASRSTN